MSYAIKPLTSSSLLPSEVLIAPSLQPTVLRLKPDARLFLEEMGRNPLFSTEDRELILDLIEAFEEEDAPESLVQFLTDILYPAVIANPREEFLKIEDRAKKLLTFLVPDDIDIAVFIRETARVEDREVDVFSEWKLIDALFDRKEDELYATGDQINESIVNGHEKLKERLLKIIQLIEVMSQQSRSQAEKVDRIKGDLSAISIEVQQLGERRDQNQQMYKQLLERCRVLFGSRK